MKRITVVVETSLEPHNLEVVLQEAVVRKSGFISRVEVHSSGLTKENPNKNMEFQKSYTEETSTDDLESRHKSKVESPIGTTEIPTVEVIEIKEHYLPPMIPEACNIGGG